MTEQVKTELKKRRGILKAKMTRIEKFLRDEVDPNAPNISKLEIRLEALHQTFKEYEEIQSQIELLDDSELDDREPIEERYYNTASTIKSILKQSIPSARSGSNTPSNEISSVVTTQTDMKLPTLNLPIFTGAYSEWLSFYDIFNSLIHQNANLNDCQRFHYLKSSLQGEPLALVESLKISIANYKSAFDLLIKRYNNERLIAQEHVQAILNSPVIQKPSHVALKKLLIDVTSNTEALKVQKLPVDQWDALIVPLITEKLDYATRREWQGKLDKTIPTLKSLTDFLEKRCDVLESLVNLNNKTNNTNKATNAKPTSETTNKNRAIIRTVTHNSKQQNCVYCKTSNHFTYKCPEFLNLSVNQRLNYINKIQACANCLRENHELDTCKSNSTCRECKSKHNTLLHQNSEANVSVVGNSCLKIDNCVTTLLSTAIVKIKDTHGNYHTCRALLDCGSQSNIITSELSKKLKVKINKINLPISGINQTVATVTRAADVLIESIHNSFAIQMHCLVLPKITEKLPIQSFSISNLIIPQNVDLADPNFYKSSDIDLLIGVQHFWELLGKSRIKLSPELHCQQTHLGWVIGGTINLPSKPFVGCSTVTSTNHLDKIIPQLWDLEEPSNKQNYSMEEIFAENYFNETTTRDAHGRFIVRLPFKNSTNVLGKSRDTALKRLYSLERKLHSNPDLKRDYHNFLNEYQQLNHMELVSTSATTETNHFFLPHHAVIKESSSTTRVRVVFDGSAKTSTGISLNEILAVGPVIQNDLFSIVLRFRTHQYCFTSDIAKMYRQIWVDPRDRQFQKILWREDSNQPVKVYELKTVTYGTSSAPYLATKCLQKLAYDERESFPLAYPIILRDFFVDDLLTGSRSIHETCELIDQLIGALQRGGFELRKWASNCPKLISDFNNTCDTIANLINLDQAEDIKALGLVWNPTSDIIKYTYKEKHVTQITKRTVLSITAQIYDILGLIAPIIVTAKILIQKLWALKVDWDELLPDHLCEKWCKFTQQLPLLNTLHIPRKTVADHTHYYELHGFCDASTVAYGACIYLRTRGKDENYTNHLICARSRVAPLKTITLPRLELCGAVLLSKLLKKVLSAINLNISSYHLWTDSTIVLAWIAAPSNSWKVFVANRVSEIQTLTDIKQWRHISTKENPADLISRGTTPEKLIKSTLWWYGPKWLSDTTINWPNSNSNLPNLDAINDEARNCQIVVLPTLTEDFSVLTKFSNLTTLRKVFAYVLRFIHNSKRSNRNDKLKGSLSAKELQNATKIIVKITQLKKFAREIDSLEKSGSVHLGSPLHYLNPFLDSDGIIRVGGRLKHASLPYDNKFPYVLPSKDHVTKLLILHEHEKLLHAGSQATLASLRQKFWPLSGRNTVRHLLHKCIKCFRVNPKSQNQLMGNLPELRVQPSSPFINCGIDYAGPLPAKEGRGRGKKSVKVYVALFICFSTKAIHLELVGDLTTESFLGALKRFFARRGKACTIFSDNATYFRSANRELQNLLNSSNFKSSVIDSLAAEGITWKFIPSRSPHRGGYWEAGIKATKYHLKRILGSELLTYEELYTLLVQIEACLKSRPITPLSSDPNDFYLLTPAHFLIGDHLTTNLEPDLTTIKENRLSRWQRVQQMTQNFWRRWQTEYLHTLQQQRNKWRRPSAITLEPGMLVVLKEENLPPLCWRLGRILATHPGPDGITRTATVKTSSGEVIRATNKICPFPPEEDL